VKNKVQERESVCLILEQRAAERELSKISKHLISVL